MSDPGHAALALIDALGGIEQIRWLAHPGLIGLLYRLAERSGMTWWKRRWTAARTEIDRLGIDEAVFEELARSMGRDDPAVSPSGEGRELPVQDFVDALAGKRLAAESWIRWAERRHLVVRGAKVQCDKCRARSWIAIPAIPPTGVTCPGCGRLVEHPFPPHSLQFTYRLGEVLRRVLEADCLDHLFALRYFHLLLHERGLVGIHPGVNFRDRVTSNVSAEADVLLLFEDATMVPGEVKRTGAGVTPEAVAKLQATSERISAPWSFFSVGQPARECQSNVPAAAARDIDQPRLVVTTDQTHVDYPVWAMGEDPFAWNPISAEEEDQRSERVVSYLRSHAPDDPWSFQAQELLSD